MTETTVSSGILGFQPFAPTTQPVSDHIGSYAELLGVDGWTSLPANVRARFDPHDPSNANKTYRGKVIETQISTLGHILVQLARVVGAPLPLENGATGPATVVLSNLQQSPTAKSSSQVWTRIYARSSGISGVALPQVIQSAKRFAGPTGLEEHLGFGLVMPLVLSVERRDLAFRATRFQLVMLGYRFTLPRWLTPFDCEVIHRDEGGGQFTFILSLTHPRFGRLVHQVAQFTDPESSAKK
jgi:Domain of unknown function (DUF4166)